MRSLIARIEEYIAGYVSLADQNVFLPLALWIMGTFCFDTFDAYPYLVITSATKRSGKTRLSEIISFCCHNPQNLAAMTGPTMFRLIATGRPTIISDEAETLSSEAATTMRAVLNVGYRKGQAIPRTGAGGEVEHFDTFCPKVFVLIGDVYDTLRDRSIVVTMHRAEPARRFTRHAAIPEGESLRRDIDAAIKAKLTDLSAAFVDHGGLPFLFDRDEEIWTSLFCLCEVFAPDRIPDLQHVAVDLATEKTAEARRYLALHRSETAAMRDEYGERLLLDLYALCVSHGKYIRTKDALDLLLATPTAPWRKYRGKGLDATMMSSMLNRFNVAPVRIAIGPKADRTCFRGYRQSDLEAALQKIGRTV